MKNHFEIDDDFCGPTQQIFELFSALIGFSLITI